MRQPKRIAIVGQAPGANATSETRPFEGGRTGRRLLDLTGARSYEELTSVAYVVNVLDTFPGKKGKGDAFPMDEAKRAAERLRPLLVVSCEHVFLTGRNVARSFGVKQGYCTPLVEEMVTWHVVPHPSPVNRIWNDERRTDEARRYMREHFKRA